MNNSNINTLSHTVKLGYQGNITFELIDCMLLILSNKLETIERNINMRKKVYSIVMECSQNLCIHVAENATTTAFDTSYVELSVCYIDNEYTICTGNFIENHKVNNLRDILSEVNSNANPVGLQKLYNKVLTNNNYSDKGGGGLGLIDIARRSNEKLLYSFEAIDDKFSFFTLKINIKK